MSTNEIQPIAVSIPDACKMSGLGRSYLYELLSVGVVHSVKTGKRRLVIVQSLHDYFASLPAATGGK